METTTKMTQTCDCGLIPPHSNPAMCARNRAATRDYVQRMGDAQGRGHVARLERQAAEEHARGEHATMRNPFCGACRAQHQD
jgi:hypothetical protein